jgi:hypothetical protein
MKMKKLLVFEASLALLALCASPQVNAQFTGKDVGTPALAGSTSTAGGTTTLVGGGSDIWGTGDNCYYYYKTVASPVWDAVVQVQGLEGPDTWTKCELMLRVPDATGIPQGGDPFIAMMTTRTNGQDTAAGQNQVGPQWRTSRGGNADQNTMGLAIHPSYKPNSSTWMRIQRTGSTFTLSYSFDGAAWTKYGDIDTLNGTPVGTDNGTRFTTPLPDSLLVGVAVTAHNDGDLTGGVAVISDLKITETPVTGVLVATTQVKDAAPVANTETSFTFTATNTAIPNGYVGAYQWYKNGQLLTNATGTQLTFLAGPGDNGAKVYCKASAAGTSMFSQTGTVTVVTGVINAGAVKWEWWTSGETRPNVEAGNVAPANRITAVTSFETPSNYADNYASRLSGLFKAPTTGNYVFFVASDDDTDVYLSSDSNPANKKLVCQETSWSGSRAWIGAGTDQQKRSDYFLDASGSAPWSTGIPLTAGQNYYIEAVHHEGGGGDNMAVTYKLFADPDPVDGDAPKLTSDVLSYFTWTATNLSITAQPQDATIWEAQTATFSVTATTDSELTPNYQWQRNGTDIAGATRSSYSFTTATTDDGAKFKCAMAIPGTGLSVTSVEAKLTVTPSPFITGLVKKEVFGPYTADSGTVAAITNGTLGTATTTTYINDFATVDGTSYYGTRLSTMFVPPASGNYVFAVSSDDDSILYLSTDDKAANKRLIAQETGWSNPRTWTGQGGGGDETKKHSDTWTDPDGNTPYASGIPLIQGTRYYIEMVQHQGTGGGSASANFWLVGGTVPDNDSASKLTGSAIGVKAPAPTRLSISKQPLDVTSYGWDWATFTVEASTDAIYPPTYQWRKNGVAIAGATTTAHSLMTSTNETGAKFDCVVSLAAYPTPATSAQATLTTKSGAVLTMGQLNEMRFGGAGSKAALTTGNVGAPTYTGTLSKFECGVGVGDNYARIVNGIFVPPTTGDYVMWVCSDDDSDLYLSTDIDPSHKRLVAQETSWSDNLKWATSGGGSSLSQKRSDTWSPDGGATTPFANGIHLEAGKPYYIEAMHNEGGGGDDLAASYTLLGDVMSDDQPTALTAAVIGTMGAAGAPALAIGKVGNVWQITYEGTLVSSDKADGTYTPVQGATSPYTVDTAGAGKFFRSVR